MAQWEDPQWRSACGDDPTMAHREDSQKAMALELQVKNLQRHNERGKLCWQEFCDAKGFGIRDPSRHNPRFLEQFLDGFFTGTLPEPVERRLVRPDDSGDSQEASSLSSMIAKVKRGQRDSSSWKEMWQSYCDAHHDGIRDPGRHGASSLRTFLEEFAPRVSGTSDSASSRDRGGRPRDDEGRGSREPLAGFGVSALAERVKQMQRRGEKYKERWVWYCDNFGEGIRDPARHSPQFLQQYIAMVESGAPMPTQAGQRFFHPYGGKGAYGMKGGGAPSSAWGGYPGYPAYPFGYPGYGAPGYAAMMYPAFGYGAWPTLSVGKDAGKARASSPKAAIADKSDKSSEDESDDDDSDSDSSSEEG